ncbi:outer membrane protein assembly factor BamE [Dyella choica]|uniref:Uncharacterized protein n=1 Tax=Dyella choica TaxID=1927959 RepID=A0A432MAN1_9GAMM|nr:outer membrane protein assembly factor BamE [Dyella choica]RUL78375.1 hypothetical protein EKH80_06010 [Dyella choica]
MNKAVAVMAVAVLLAGCATTSGTKVDPTAIASFQPGVTTVAQAEAALGQPFLVTHTSDGGQQLQYVSKHQEVTGDGMPTTGSQIPKHVEKSVSTVLVFDQNGYFVSSSSNSTTKDNKYPSELGNLGAGDVNKQMRQ